MRILLATVLLLFPFIAGAVETELSCYWEPKIPDNGIKKDDAMGLYANSRDTLRIRVGVEPDSISFPDPQSVDAIIFPLISLESSDSRLKVSAPNPNIRSLKGQPSVITILIDRYTLDSSMLLALIDPATGKLGGHWVRLGKCAKRQI